MIDFIENDPELTILVSVKRFDASCVDEFRGKLNRLPEQEFDPIHVDLDGVEMIDSSAVGALLGVQKKVGGAERRLILDNAHPAVVSVIELLRLHRIFDVRRSVLGESTLN